MQVEERRNYYEEKTILDFRRMAVEGEKIVYLTGYDYLTAKYEERAGVDMILVGDSLGNVILGYDSTYPVTMEDMMLHCKAVRRGAPNTFIVGDMPFMSYQVSDEEAVINAGRLCKEARVDCVKLEGITDSCISRVKAINDAGMLVMGHIGLTPQFGAQMGGNKAQGKSCEAALKLVEAAKKTGRGRSVLDLSRRSSCGGGKGHHRTSKYSHSRDWSGVLYPRTALDLCGHGRIF